MKYPLEREEILRLIFKSGKDLSTPTYRQRNPPTYKE